MSIRAAIARARYVLLLAMLGLWASVAGSVQPSARLDVAVTGIKSNKGVIRMAICPPSTGFPDCKASAIKSASLPIANGAARLEISGLTPGKYAISVFHDANANGKLDTFMGIPREGYGFSRNPPFAPRAPRWNEAELIVSGDSQATIALRYLL